MKSSTSGAPADGAVIGTAREELSRAAANCWGDTRKVMMTDVTDNRAEGRYELAEDGHIAFAAYQLEGETIRFTHTEVPEELAGRGMASRLVGGALADVERRRLSVVPLCSFVRAYIEKHPETARLLAKARP